MPIEPTNLWHCPTCRQSLQSIREGLLCHHCEITYPLIVGIPDLRVSEDAWVDLDEDRERAKIAAARVCRDGLEPTIRSIFLDSRGMSGEMADSRTRRLLADVAKCQSQCSDWLQSAVEINGVILEIGCGPGQFLAAAAAHGPDLIGIDVSLEWLVIARHLAERHGGRPYLAAGFAEFLPLADRSVDAVVSLDVIEHVGNQVAYVSELGRVLKPGACFALSTPNRYSLAPEPHVHVWGVGYLPRSLQARYVKLVKNQSYTFTRLLSVRETKNLFSKERGFDAKIVFPKIPEHELTTFKRHSKALARIYNWMIEFPMIKMLLPFFGAYYRVCGNLRN